MLEKKMLTDVGNSVMRKLFGVEPGWHRNLDIIKNNYALAERHMARGNTRDAIFRLKFLLWLDAGHKAGLLLLAKAYIAEDDKVAANKTLKKLLALDPDHKEAKYLRAVILGKAPPPPTLAVAADSDAHAFYLIHKECFPVYWKEQEISDMLLASGTQGWLATIGKPVGMLITRAQFEQAEILTIAVLPDARKTGVAKRLMLEAEPQLAASGVKKIFLEVDANNQPATALYRQLGYSEVSRRKGYYKQADGSLADALVMAKELG